MNKKKVTSIHKSRSEKKDMPSAVDDAADVMSKYDKIREICQFCVKTTKTVNPKNKC